MNYYEHHIRDYDAATSHLSWDEDMAYTRLMRWYYRKERPIPADVAEACRQIRATSRQRQAVESVLKEFFTLRDDGWHQETCDEVIAAFQAGEPEREVKKGNEDLRMKRHRDERAALFKKLNAAGRHAPWNTKIEDLRKLVEGHCGAETATAPATPATQPATAPATPATATQTPVPSTHSPVPTPHSPDTSSQLGIDAVGAPAPAAPAPPPSPFAGETDIERLNGKAIVALADAWELPTQWGVDAESLGWKPTEVLREAERFRQYWTRGRGKGTRRSVKGWSQSWSNWLAKAANERDRR